VKLRRGCIILKFKEHDMNIFKLGGKEKPDFKVGHYVKVNEGMEIETGEIVDNWAGEITEIRGEHDVIEITFDAETLNSISDEYLIECDEKGYAHYTYVFEKSDLTPIQRRDTEEEYQAAAKAYDLRFAQLTGDMVSVEEEMRDKWFGLFSKSPFFDQLDDTQKGNADFAIDVFINYLDGYIGTSLHDCDPGDAEEMCMDILPRKVSADDDFFKGLASLIATFFEFLEADGHIPEGNGKAVKNALKGMDKKVLAASKDPQNWGMAKSMVMSAEAQGFDMGNEDDRNKFMQLQQLNALSGLVAEKRDSLNKLISENRGVLSSKEPFVNQDPYKNFKRNTKVSVRYPGGKTKERVSFKRVEKDLRAGKCTLI